MIVTIIEIKRPALTSADEEEIKRRAVEEYLMEQQKAKENAPENSGEK